jgi:hypothetical protein
MARWEQAKKLKRDPFARVVGQIEDGFLEEEPFFPRYSRIPDTFAEWEVISYDDEPPLFEVNPYIDRIENDPILILCAGMTHEDEEYRPPKAKPPMGWEEYTRRQSLYRKALKDRSQVVQTGEGRAALDDPEPALDARSAARMKMGDG